MTNRIKEIRESLGLKQAELGGRVGISASYLSQIETGSGNKRPSVDLMRKIAQALDVGFYDLFEGHPGFQEEGVAEIEAGLMEIPEEQRQQAIQTLLSVLQSFKPRGKIE